MALVVACIAVTCSKGSSSPTSPSSGGGLSDASYSYLASVPLPAGVTGFVSVSTTTRVAQIAIPSALRVLLTLIEPSLIAQSGTAAGSLTLSDGCPCSADASTRRGHSHGLAIGSTGVGPIGVAG